MISFLRSGRTLALGVACGLAGVASASAASLAGSVVSGSISPNNSDISVTSQFTSPATIGGGTEFTGSIFDAAYSQTFNIASNFMNNGLEITFTSPNAQSNLADGDLFSLVFSDTAFAGTFSLSSYGCNNNQKNYCNTQSPPNGLLSDTMSGNTLTLQFDEISAGQVYDFSYSPTPEPGSFVLLGTGLLGVAGAVRRRRA